MMAYTIPEFGPSDLLDSNVEGSRRVKTSATLIDSSGNSPRSSLTQDLVTGVRTDFINVQFQYNLPVGEDSSDIDGAVTGTGELAHSHAMAEANTGEGAGSAHVTSKDSIRYYPGHEFAGEMTAFAVNPTAGSRALWGIGDVNGAGDAVLFGYVGETFGALFRSSGVEQFIPSSEFNGEQAPELDPQSKNLWTFRGGWYGILPIQWGVFYKGRYITLHTIDLTNSQQHPHLGNATLPMMIEAVSDGTSGFNTQVNSSSWRGGIVGDKPAGSRADRQQTQQVLEKSVSGNTLTPLISIRNKETFQGKVNHVRVRYGTVTLTTDGTKSVRFDVYKNATLTGAVFADQNPVTSVTEYDKSATAITPTSGAIGGTFLNRLDRERINFFTGDAVISIYPGETVTLAAFSTNGTEVNAFLRILEEF